LRRNKNNVCDFFNQNHPEKECKIKQKLASDMQLSQNSYIERRHLSLKYKENYSGKYEYRHHNKHAM